MLSTKCNHCGNEITLNFKMVTKVTGGNAIITHVLNVVQCNKCGNLMTNSNFPTNVATIKER